MVRLGVDAGSFASRWRLGTGLEPMHGMLRRDQAQEIVGVGHAAAGIAQGDLSCPKPAALSLSVMAV